MFRDTYYLLHIGAGQHPVKMVLHVPLLDIIYICTDATIDFVLKYKTLTRFSEIVSKVNQILPDPESVRYRN